MKWPFSSKREPFENLASDDIVIVVIGPTGVGKSTFINTAAGERLLEDEKKASDGKTSLLSPCTTEFTHVRCTFEDSRRVVFVDTPAFPDPYGSSSLSAEKEIGNKISDWLKRAFGKRIKVTGILYLHNITDNRLTEPPLPHYEMFRKLCGKEYPGSVILVLTMWEKVDPEIGQRRKEYLTNHWKKMISGKAAVYCHDGTKQSAWEAVKALGVL
ncbi:hypothetical protein BYT27DRAFT_7183861 [Phlegmacium glaucopus]|nr:hypothetical protein BYT27DRAFT_7183861 [Phlegmacium glaucopus]